MTGIKPHLCPRGHYEVSLGTPRQNYEYCSKEHRANNAVRFYELGDITEVTARNGNGD